jgi:hypothetical protein
MLQVGKLSLRRSIFHSSCALALSHIPTRQLSTRHDLASAAPIDADDTCVLLEARATVASQGDFAAVQPVFAKLKQVLGEYVAFSPHSV